MQKHFLAIFTALLVSLVLVQLVMMAFRISFDALKEPSVLAIIMLLAVPIYLLTRKKF